MNSESCMELNELERDGAGLSLVAQYPDGIPSPREIEARLVELGFRGQTEARRKGSVLLYTHLRRAYRCMVEGADASELGPRENWLFLGQSGAGKTYLMELLGQIANLPVVTIDATQYTETGIVGEDVSTILTRLYNKAGNHKGRASCGIVFIDEIDKISAPFEAGARNSSSREGVQRSLLTLLGSSTAEFPVKLRDWSRAERVVLPLHCVTFVLAGAFTGIEKVAESEDNRTGVGFQGKSRRFSRKIFPSLGTALLERTEILRNYGLMPELCGRLHHFIRFQPLDVATLKDILVKNLLPAYRTRFEDEGFDLQVDDQVLDLVAQKALERETAARGLVAALAPVLDEVVFDHFGNGEEKTEEKQVIRLVVESQEVKAVLA